MERFTNGDEVFRNRGATEACSIGRMRKDRKVVLVQAVSCLLCAVIAREYGRSFEGTEFGAGWLTGSLLDMKDAGSLLFVLALVLTFIRRRIGATVSLVACALCLPLYLYFTAPSIFHGVFKGAW